MKTMTLSKITMAKATENTSGCTLVFEDEIMDDHLGEGVKSSACEPRRGTLVVEKRRYPATLTVSRRKLVDADTGTISTVETWSAKLHNPFDREFWNSLYEWHGLEVDVSFEDEQRRLFEVEIETPDGEIVTPDEAMRRLPGLMAAKERA